VVPGGTTAASLMLLGSRKIFFSLALLDLGIRFAVTTVFYISKRSC
jgi:hypothetical protein